MRIIDLSEEDQEQIYIACFIIEKILEKHGDLSLSTFINDNKHNSIISLSYHNNRKLTK